MDAAVEKLEQAKAKLQTAGDSCPDLDHLLEALLGLRRAEALIPADHAAAPTSAGGGIALPVPDAKFNGTIELFQGLWAYLQSAALGMGSVGYWTSSPRLVSLMGTSLGPYGSLGRRAGGAQYFQFIPAAELDSLAQKGVLGSLSVLQVLAASLCEVHMGRGDSVMTESMDRVASVMRAVWGTSHLSALQRGQRQRLDQRQWVPQLPRLDAEPGKVPQVQMESMEPHLSQHCGLAAGAGGEALWELCLTVRLIAGARLDSPSKPQLQQLLCDGQALLSRCTSAAATSRHLTSAVMVSELAITGSAHWGMDGTRRQALVGLLEAIIARAEEHKCWYCAAYASLALAQLCAQLAAGVGAPRGLRMRGAGAAGIGEANALRQRAQEAATAVASYHRRVKPWLPGGLQQVAAGWLAGAAQLGAAPYTPAQAAAASAADAADRPGQEFASGNFPVCSRCGSASLHVRKCAACRTAAYCSKECQAGDWKSHKPQCKAIVAAQRSSGAA